MRRSTQGHDKAHPDIAVSFYCLGDVYYEQENYEEAAKLYKQGLEKDRTVYGRNSIHSEIAVSLCNLAKVY